MVTPRRKPIICVTASAQAVTEPRPRTVLAAGERYVCSLAEMVDCLPLMLPPLGERIDVADTVAHIDGLVLTGGRANVEPHHYGGSPFPDDEPIDPGRDAVVLPLIRACIDAGVPVFGICRGIQEINVALGGSLHYRLHVLEGKDDHRMPRDPEVPMEEIFRLRHPVHLAEGGLFRDLAGATEVMVNSLHGQGVDRLAEGLVTEAVSHDDVVEGLRLDDADRFVVGVQWHAEWEPADHPLSGPLYRAFGEAAQERAARRNGRG
jgi:putative glutamine amidotransferase